MTPDFGYRARPGDHDLVADERVDQPLHGFQIERLCGDAVQFAQSLETGHHFVGFRRPAHLPRCRFADSLLNQAEARRCQSVRLVPRADDMPCEIEVTFLSGPLIKKRYGFEYGAGGQSFPTDPACRGDVRPAPGARLGDQVVGHAPGRFERGGLFRLVVVGQQAEQHVLAAPDVPVAQMTAVGIGADVAVGALRGHQFADGPVDRRSVLGARRVAVAHHRGGEPLAPEFGTETPVAVGLVAERLHETLDILSHQPVIDAQVELFAQIAADTDGSVRSGEERIVDAERRGFVRGNAPGGFAFGAKRQHQYAGEQQNGRFHKNRFGVVEDKIRIFGGFSSSGVGKPSVGGIFRARRRRASGPGYCRGGVGKAKSRSPDGRERGPIG